MHRKGLTGRIVAYYRVSSEEQRQGQTIDSQRGFVRNWCQRQEVVLGAEYFDEGDNGEGEVTERKKRSKRKDGSELPCGADLMRDAGHREFDTVIVFAVDRTGRRLYSCAHFFEKLHDLGVRVVSATQEFDPDEISGSLLLGLLAGQSQADKKTIVNRFESGKANWQSVPDTYTGGKVPMGMATEYRGRRQYYIVCRDRIPGGDCSPEDVIRYIFDRCDEGVTCGGIAENLNARGITTYWVPTDRKYSTPSRVSWTPQRVQEILTNPFYKGVQYIGDKKKSPKAVRPEPTPHQVPAIVGEEQWKRCQEVLKQNRKLADRNAGQFYLLRGQIRCRCCGGHFTGTPSVGRNMPRGRYYRCYQQSRGNGCQSTWLEADALEETIKTDILWILGHTDPYLVAIQERLGSESERVDQYLTEAARLDKARAALDATETEYYRMRAAGLIPTDDKLRQLLTELQVKADALSAQSAEARDRATAIAATEQRLRSNQQLLEAYHARAEAGYTNTEWRHLVQLLVDRVEIETETTAPPLPRRPGRPRLRRPIAHPYYWLDDVIEIDTAASGSCSINLDYISGTELRALLVSDV